MCADKLLVSDGSVLCLNRGFLHNEGLKYLWVGFHLKQERIPVRVKSDDTVDFLDLKEIVYSDVYGSMVGLSR